MKEKQSSAHVKPECKHHLVTVPKYRKKSDVRANEER